MKEIVQKLLGKVELELKSYENNDYCKIPRIFSIITSPGHRFWYMGLDIVMGHHLILLFHLGKRKMRKLIDNATHFNTHCSILRIKYFLQLLSDDVSLVC